jgi:hypothetical protein
VENASPENKTMKLVTLASNLELLGIEVPEYLHIQTWPRHVGRADLFSSYWGMLKQAVVETEAAWLTSQ